MFVWQDSVLYVVLAILKLTSSDLFCELPLVDEDSIKYEFFAERSGADWTLNALVSWDAPPSDAGIGYDAYFVRFDTDRLAGKLLGLIECDIEDLYDDFQYTSDTSFLFPDIKFGYEYYFSIFVVNVEEGRRSGKDSYQKTNISLDCYNATRDMKFCQDLPIVAASSPTNPQAVCLTPTKANDTMFKAILIEWGAPVQVNPDGILSNFIIDFSSDGNILLSKKRPVTEVEMVAAQTTDQFNFTTNLEGFDADLSRNDAYVVKIYSIVQNISQYGNEISTTINTTDLPVCVEWSDWSSWTPSECCGDNIYQNQNRTCEDRFTTGLTCDGLGSRNRTCECALLNPFQVGLLTCGTAIIAACIMALIWKFYVRSKEGQGSEDGDEIFIPKREPKEESTLSPGSIFGDKEICREDLSVHFDELLGSGAQGCVYKGKLRAKGEWLEVAVKTPKLDDKTSSQRELMKDTFLKEIQFSIDVQWRKGHPNILPILGCCTLKEPYYLVTPLMKYGDLLSFLRKCKQVRLGDDILQAPYNLSPIDQLNILRHIAQGMEFLSGNHFYMGDLAASNVLLGEDLVAKIADFGLGFDIYLTSGTVKRQQDRPFQFRPRWVSLETYKSNGADCNLKSDIWSFGIVMYEVYSFGEIPYSVKWSNSQLLMELKRGYRLAKPRGCPPEMYDMMLRCWQANPNQRPTFTALVKEFNQKIDALTHQKSLLRGYITVVDSDAPGQENLALDENTEITNHTEDTINEIDGNEADVESDHESNLESQGDIESGESFHHDLNGISTSDTSGPEFISDSNQFSGDSVTDFNIASGESNRPDDYHLWANLRRNSGEPVSSEFIRIPEQNVLLNSEVVDINDYHDFKRFPDDEAKEAEKEVTL